MTEHDIDNLDDIEDLDDTDREALDVGRAILKEKLTAQEIAKALKEQERALDRLFGGKE